MFNQTEESWNMLYSEPEPVINQLLKRRGQIQDKRMSVLTCPASNDFFKNLYVFKSTIEDSCRWPEGYLKAVTTEMSPKQLDDTITLDFAYGNKIAFVSPRPSSVVGHVDLLYNMSWLFFADEPLTVRFTAPYYPPFTPMKDAILTSGQFDIGQWFRPWNLNYFVPFDCPGFDIKQDDPIFYFHAFTEKRIIFKRFQAVQSIQTLYDEFVRAPGRYGRLLPLSERYELAKKTKMREIILKEITNNLVD
jgi:hypothetical protein